MERERGVCEVISESRVHTWRLMSGDRYLWHHWLARYRYLLEEWRRSRPALCLLEGMSTEQAERAIFGFRLNSRQVMSWAGHWMAWPLLYIYWPLWPIDTFYLEK